MIEQYPLEITHTREAILPPEIIEQHDFLIDDQFLEDEGSKLSFIQKLRSVASATRKDVENSDKKALTIGMGFTVAGIQALSRLQASWVFVPDTAVSVLKDTHSPEEAALAGASIFGAWCLATGAATIEGLHRYPKAVDEFSTSYPGFVNFFKDSLVGVEAPEQTAERTSNAKRLGSRLMMAFRRGFTVVGLGSAVYAGTSTASGATRKEAHKINANAALDGGLMTGGIIFAIGQSIVSLGETHPALAERIQNDATNIKLWYGVAAAFMVESFVENRYKRFKSSKNETKEPIPVPSLDIDPKQPIPVPSLDINGEWS